MTTQKKFKKIFLPALLLAVLMLNINTAVAQNNKNSGIESKIEIKIDGGVNENQQAKIQELLDYFNGQNPRLKIKAENQEPKFEENESWLDELGDSDILVFLAAVFVYIFSAIVAAGKLGKRRVNLINNILMAVFAILSVSSGILLFLRYKIFWVDLKFWHGIISIVLASAIVFHIITHRRVWRSYFKL